MNHRFTLMAVSACTEETSMIFTGADGTDTKGGITVPPRRAMSHDSSRPDLECVRAYTRSRTRLSVWNGS
jgi:hypothetical protein